MNISNTDLDGVLIVEPEIHEDNRGFLIETFTLSKYKEEFGLELKFVQDNLARTFKNTLRGLHFQKNFQYQSAKVQDRWRNFRFVDRHLDQHIVQYC